MLNRLAICLAVVVFFSTTMFGFEAITPQDIRDRVDTTKKITDSIIVYRGSFDSVTNYIQRIRSLQDDIPGLYSANAGKIASAANDSTRKLLIQLETEKRNNVNLQKLADTVTKRDQTKLMQLVKDIMTNRDSVRMSFDSLRLINDALVASTNSVLKSMADTSKAKFDLYIEMTTLRDTVKTFRRTNDSLIQQLNQYESAIQIGLSIGINGFFNGPRDFIVREDSTIRMGGKPYGLSGMISTVISFTTLPGQCALINIPLGEIFSTESSKGMGVFNKRLALGLGYGIRISRISPSLLFGGILNISPYEDIDFDEIKTKKFKLPEYTKIDPSDYGSSTNYMYSISLGLIYNFSNFK